MPDSALLPSATEEAQKDAARLKTLLTAIAYAETNDAFLTEFARLVKANQDSPAPVGLAKIAIDHCVAKFGSPKEGRNG